MGYRSQRDKPYAQIQYTDLIYRSQKAIKRTLKHLPSQIIDRGRFETICEKFDFSTSTAEKTPTLASLLSFLTTFQDILGPEREIIYVLDNVDQCSGKNVSLLCEVARAVFLDTESFVVVAMRPPVYREHFTLWHDKGSFVRYLIVLSPPDISTIIERRLDTIAAGMERIAFLTEQGTTITIKDPAAQIVNIARILFSDQGAKDLLYAISDNNVRYALIAFVSFLRYRGLNYRLLFPRQGSIPESEVRYFKKKGRLVSPRA